MRVGFVVLRFVACCAALVGLLGLVGSAPPAGAGPTATLSGTVTDGTVPLAGISVTVLGSVYGQVVTTAVTDAAGAYSVTVGAPANVKVLFKDPTHDHADRYNGGAVTISAAPIVALTGGAHPVVNAVLPSFKGTISGHVTDASSAGLSGITVLVFNAFYGNQIDSQVTDATGYWSSIALNPNNYRVQFIDPTNAYAGQWNSGAGAFASAPNVVVTSGITTTVDASLPVASTIEGIVTNGGRPVAGALVVVLDAVGTEIVTGAVTDATGAYTVPGVSPGPHKVVFVDPRIVSDPAHSLRPLVWPGLDPINLTLAAALAAATPVTVPADQPAVADAALVGTQCSMGPGGSLAGLNLTGADLSGCLLTGTNLTGATLTATKLFGAGLSTAVLANVTGSGTDLSDAVLIGADLTGAHLTTPDFSRADLSDAVFTGTTVLTTPVWSDTTCPDHTNSDANGGTCFGHLFHPVLTVSSTADLPDVVPGDGLCDAGSGACTLRAAVMEANASAGADTITLQAGATYLLTRSGANEDAAATGDLDLTSDVTIVGQGATVDASGLGDRVFHVVSPTSPTRPASLRASNLTVTGGSSVVLGGGILGEAPLTLTDVTVTGNRAQSGGGIAGFVDTHVTRGVVTGNTAGGPGSAGAGFGGGIELGGEAASLTDVDVHANTAASDPASASSSQGGGLHSSAETLTVTGGSFTDNVVEDSAGTGQAGGIDISNSSSTMLTGVTVSGNDATAVSAIDIAFSTVVIDSATIAGSDHAGAYTTAVVSSFRSHVTITDSDVRAGASGAASTTVIDSWADPVGDLNVIRSTVAGGGEGIDAVGPVTIDRSVVTGNAGVGINHQISGLADIVSSTISDNGPGVGEVYQSGGSMTIRSSTVAGNHTGIIAAGGPLTLTGSVVDHDGSSGAAACSAAVTSGGHNVVRDSSCGIAGPGDQAGVDPQLGALGNNGGPTLTRLPADGSPAIDAAGASCGLGVDQRGATRPQGYGCDAGAVETAFVAPPAGTLLVTSALDAVDVTPGDGQCATAAGECTLRAAVQEANAGPANTIWLRPNAQYDLTLAGAAENAAATGDLDVTAPLTIIGHDATVSAAGLGDRVFDAPYAAGSSLTLTTMTVTGGSVTGEAGGGISSAVPLTLDTVWVSNNTADPAGGGVASTGGIHATDSTITLNVASSSSGGAGGGLYATGTVDLHDTSVYGNEALAGAGGGGSAGGVLQSGGSFTMTGGSLVGNSAAGTSGAGGGGLFIENGTALLDGVDASSNSAMAGAAVRASASTVTVRRGGVADNTCAEPTCLSTIEVIEGDLTIDSTYVIARETVSAVAFSAATHGTLHVIDSTVTTTGEGITSNGPGTIERTTIRGWTTTPTSSVGIHHFGTAPLDVVNSTIADIGQQGFGYGLLAEGPVQLLHTTVGRTWRSVGTLGSGSVTVTASILQHTGSAGTADCTGAITSGGSNVIADATCGVAAPGDQLSADALLSVFLENGGPTPTLLPGAGSVAIDAAGATCAVATDQRGISRPQGAGCDAGAVEQ